MSRDKRTSVSTASTGTTAEKSADNVFRESESVNLPFTVYSTRFLENLPRVVLAFKVRPEVHIAYRKLPRSLKRLVRDILEQTILNIGKAQVRKEEKNIIVNVPVNIAMQKMEVNQQPSYDIELLREENRILKNDLRKAKQIIQHLKKEKEELKHEAHALRKQITILEKKLREIQPYAQAYLKLKQREKLKQLLR